MSKAAKLSLNTLYGIKQRPDDYGTSPGQMVVRVRRVGNDGAFMTLGNLAKQMQKKRAEKMLAGGGAAMDKQEQAEDSDVDLVGVEMVDSQEDEGARANTAMRRRIARGDSDGNAEVRVGGNDMRMSLTLNLTGWDGRWWCKRHQ